MTRYQWRLPMNGSRPILGLVGVVFALACIFSSVASAAPRGEGASARKKEPSAVSQSKQEHPASSQTFGAQSAFLTGGLSLVKSASGQMFIQGFASKNSSARAILAVNVPKDGSYPVSFDYSNSDPTIARLNVLVNGIHQGTVSFEGGKTSWASTQVQLRLRTGMNTIWLEQSPISKASSLRLHSFRVQGSNNQARGATVPYIEYLAPSFRTNGQRIGPTRDYYSFSGEAVGRQAVKLSRVGQYVEIRLTRPANAVDVRYAIPDAKSGGGIDAPLTMYINGKKASQLHLTSKYSWIYGPFPGNKNPQAGHARAFYNEVRILLGKELPAGTTIRLQKDSQDTAEYYIINLIDMQNVPPPYKEPANFISVTQFGAVPNSNQDASPAFAEAISEAQAEHKGVWIPPGSYNLISNRISLYGSVTIRGAGPWYSILTGPNAGFEGYGAGTFQIYDLAIIGTTNQRIDSAPDNGLDGNFGVDSVIQNVWIEQKKVGAWINWPTTGLLIVGSIIRDTMADGVNFSGGTTNSVVEQTAVRNTGDDGLAIWSATYLTHVPSQNNTFKYNTVQSPWLANDVGIYGGINSTVEDNLLYDSTGYGGGIDISTVFPMEPFQGYVRIIGNTLVRTGGYEFSSHEALGAIRISAQRTNINAAITIKDNTVDASTYQGFEIRGPNAVTNLTVENLLIDGAGSYGIQMRDGAQGSGRFSHVVVQHAKLGGFNNLTAPLFTIHKGTGNQGW